MNGLTTFSIGSRRYLGNKTKLLPFILEVVKAECQGIKSVADIFSGTGKSNIKDNSERLFLCKVY